MSRHYNDGKLKLGEPWAAKINDFLIASHKAEFVELVRRAVDMYIDDYLDKNRGFAKDYKTVKAEREKEEGG